MELPPGLAAARRTITLVCAALAVVAVLGALAYSFKDTGNNCGSGWAAANKPLPDPLITPADEEVIKRDKLNPYEFSVNKAKPARECRSAGSKQLITAGLGASLILLPVLGLLGYLYYPRREELTETPEVIDISDGADDPAPVRGSRWSARRKP